MTRGGQGGSGPRPRGGAIVAGIASRLMLVALVPSWIWVALLVLAIGIALVLIVGMAIDGTSAQAVQDWHYQCDSAIGPDPALTETTDPTESLVTAAVSPSQVPTENPYASMTFAPGDDPSAWDLACASAMRSAPYQQQPLQVAASGAAVACAGQLGVESEGRRVAGTSAALTADLVYRASVAGATGQCQGLGDAAGSAAPGAVNAACARSGSASGSVVLPNTIAAQGLCGQRVAITAVSAGDLVFWDYQDNAPTRVGMALGVEQMVTVDPGTGRVVRESLPSGNGVRVKRVLGSVP